MISKRYVCRLFLVNFTLALSLVSGCGGNAAAEPKTDWFVAWFPAATDTKEIVVSEDILTKVNLKKTKVMKITGPAGRLGYCVESDVVGRSGPFRIRTVIDSQFAVKQTAVLSYPAQRGREVRSAVFTRQFEGKGPADPIRVGQDIVAVTGATVSCNVMAEGVREVIILAKLLEADLTE